MNCSGVLYFPITVSVFEGLALELIEARYGLKGVAVFMKLLCKVYKEEGYYLLWRDEQCSLFAHRLGNELTVEQLQGVIDILVEKEIFDERMYNKHHVLTSERIQKVWLEATKRRKRDLNALPYFLVETKPKQKDKEENAVQDVASDAENACNSEQSRVNESIINEMKETPPLTPHGEDGDGVAGNASPEIPGYAYNKKTHNLEGLILELKQLHIVDPDEIKAILRLSDYGRLGSYVFRIINSTRWSAILAKGKYIIAALRKERTRNG